MASSTLLTTKLGSAEAGNGGGDRKWDHITILCEHGEGAKALER